MLVVKTCDVNDAVISFIRQTHGVDIDYSNIPTTRELTDNKILVTTDTYGEFVCESFEDEYETGKKFAFYMKVYPVVSE